MDFDDNMHALNTVDSTLSEASNALGEIDTDNTAVARLVADVDQAVDAALRAAQVLRAYVERRDDE